MDEGKEDPGGAWRSTIGLEPAPTVVGVLWAASEMAPKCGIPLPCMWSGLPDSLLMNGTQQKRWYVTSEIRLLEDGRLYLGYENTGLGEVKGRT